METEMSIYGLRYAVTRENLVSSSIGAHRKADSEQNCQPIPVENLGAEDQQYNGAAQDQRYGKRGLLNEQIADLS